ncbi:hypothetical protein RDI58_010884 [Solanum bulbocastanum]|uniref:Uncharacterized protein n=1 Tax=Solanum bulbocastanum TaxID=147425 RepID=A0AAN8YJX6_SOLBU
MKISKWVDLRDKAREKAIFGEIANNCSVESWLTKYWVENGMSTCLLIWNG